MVKILKYGFSNLSQSLVQKTDIQILFFLKEDFLSKIHMQTLDANQPPKFQFVLLWYVSLSSYHFNWYFNIKIQCIFITKFSIHSASNCGGSSTEIKDFFIKRLFKIVFSFYNILCKMRHLPTSLLVYIFAVIIFMTSTVFANNNNAGKKICKKRKI